MNFENKVAEEIDDPELAQALQHFKASVDAWSGAVYSRPRTTVVRTVRFAAANWRLAASWTLGCVLAAGCLAGALYERHHRQEQARIAAVQTAAQKAAKERAAAEQAAAANAVTRDQDLLATVDSDVSREVPAAMEPLAQLMDDDGTR
jgi:hypothetical protein